MSVVRTCLLALVPCAGASGRGVTSRSSQVPERRFASIREGREALCRRGGLSSQLTKLQQMGPQSTVGDLRQTESQLAATEKRIAKRAKHDKRARDIHAAIDDLNRAVDQLPDGSTLASAQEKIQDKRARSPNAASAFSQTYCSTG